MRRLRQRPTRPAPPRPATNRGSVAGRGDWCQVDNPLDDVVGAGHGPRQGEVVGQLGRQFGVRKATAPSRADACVSPTERTFHGAAAQRAALPILNPLSLCHGGGGRVHEQATTEAHEFLACGKKPREPGFPAPAQIMADRQNLGLQFVNLPLSCSGTAAVVSRLSWGLRNV